MKQRKFIKNSFKNKTQVVQRNVQKLNIWIDGYEANVPQRLGSSQVAFELLRNLEKIDQDNNYTILLPNTPVEDLPRERPRWQYKVLKPAFMWTRVRLPIALYTAKEKPDMIFSPTHYVPRFSPVPRIVTVFDLSYLHFSQMFLKKDLYKLQNWTKYSILNSKKIVTISKFTKEDIVENYKIDRKKIAVAYPGYDDQVFKPIENQDKISEIKTKYHLDTDYLIYVGTIQPRKNLIRLIEAFAKVSEENVDLAKLKLVLVGKTKGQGRQGWMFDEILATPQKYGIEDKVIFTGFAPTEDLPYLIAGAKAFVWPSLWEGFGIPVIESMACQTPVIVSNVSSLPEVAGQAGLFVDPFSVDQIAQAIATIVTDKKLHNKLSKQGLEQAKKFSWKKMAKEVLKVFEEVSLNK